MTSLKLNQLTQRMGRGAYLNIEEGDLHVYAWTSCYTQPTYLVQMGIQVGLIQFDSQEMADEWLEERKDVPEIKVTLLDG